MEYKAGQTFIRWDGCFLIKRVNTSSMTILIKVSATSKLIEKETFSWPGVDEMDKISMDFFCQVIGKSLYKECLKMLFD